MIAAIPGTNIVRRLGTNRYNGTNTIITVAQYAMHTFFLPLITDTLPFTEKVRRALIRNRSDTSHSEVITGKMRNGVPLARHEHAHYFATDEDGDGRLDHLTIYAPRGFDKSDLEALGNLRSIHRRDNFPDVKMVLTGLGTAEHKLDAPLFRPSKRWRSVTPFSLPRFANRGGGKPPRPRDLPAAQLRRELKVRGLPEPVSVKTIEGYAPAGRPLVRWLEFHSRRYNGSSGYGLAGFEIEFAEEIRGPVALGFACHFGLGLFSPF